jgi:hypothetical protein
VLGSDGAATRVEFPRAWLSADKGAALLLPAAAAACPPSGK